MIRARLSCAQAYIKLIFEFLTREMTDYEGNSSDNSNGISPKSEENDKDSD